jgi:hypothetical protein
MLTFFSFQGLIKTGPENSYYNYIDFVRCFIVEAQRIPLAECIQLRCYKTIHRLYVLRLKL